MIDCLKNIFKCVSKLCFFKLKFPKKKIFDTNFAGLGFELSHQFTFRVIINAPGVYLGKICLFFINNNIFCHLPSRTKAEDNREILHTCSRTPLWASTLGQGFLAFPCSSRMSGTILYKSDTSLNMGSLGRCFWANSR